MKHVPRLLPAAVAAVLVLAVAGCGDSGGGSPGSGKVTLEFAQAGLGTELDATKAAIADFEKANPDITVKLVQLSSDATQYGQQLQQRFIAGSATPDVVEVDETNLPSYAKSGWLLALDAMKPDTDGFLPAALRASTYNGKRYALPWFVNTEGLFYRTDLVPTPPATADELVAAAQAAMKKDPAIKYGLAFEGAKYEGVITSFMVMQGGFGGKLDPANLDTPENRRALEFMRDTITKHKIAPQAVTGWKEGEVQQAFTSGQAVFAINWPFVFGTAKGTPVENKVGFVPFLGKGATLGVETLAVNAKTRHADAAYKLLRFMSNPETQVKRAIATGNPPSVTAAYNDQLYAGAAFFKQVQPLAGLAAVRPGSPTYPKVSAELQTMFSSVLSGLAEPGPALTETAAKLKTIGSS
jgi:multiple sugar transport system substrate-binding protein